MKESDEAWGPEKKHLLTPHGGYLTQPAGRTSDKCK